MTVARAPLPYGLDRQTIQRAASFLGLDMADPRAVRLVSRRMTLRTWAGADSADLLALDADARVNLHLIDAGVSDRNEAVAFMAIANALCASGNGLGVWRAGSRDNDRFLGYFLLAPDPEGRVEVGVRLEPPAWGRGYALEGGRLLCDYGIDTLHLPEIWGFCHPDNRAVPVLLRRLHFTPLGGTTHLGHPALAFRLDAAAWRAHPMPARARDVVRRTQAGAIRSPTP